MRSSLEEEGLTRQNVDHAQDSDDGEKCRPEQAEGYHEEALHVKHSQLCKAQPVSNHKLYQHSIRWTRLSASQD